MSRLHVFYGWAWASMVAASVVVASLAGPASARQIEPTSHAELIRGLVPGVVNIAARIGVAETPDRAQASASGGALPFKISGAVGSGFVIDPSGLIATNWHVVTDAVEIVVGFSDGSQLLAKIVGAWRAIDLALLKVEVGHPLQAIRWGDSSAVQIGDPVLAMGNAFGVGLSVSAGIVSALNRNIGDSVVDNFIQTDAAINHGNSGGPLFNLAGEVIGVSSTIISSTSANAGLGFAIPSNDAQFVFRQMMHLPDAERPAWLGAKLQAVTPEMAEAMGQRQVRGAIVAAVRVNEPAQNAGMLAGDVILRFDGRTFPDDRALIRAVTMRKPGEQVTFTIWRDGQEIELKATLETWPASVWELNAAPSPPDMRLFVPPDLGLTMTALTDDLRTAYEIASDAGGVLVTAVAPGSAAARQDVTAGDLVLKVGQNRVWSPEELWREVDLARTKGRQYGLFMMLAKKQPDTITQFPGPRWIALRIAAD